MTQAPLKGIRILDLTNVLAGPFCCHQLAHMGADVIKVETPGTGDLARQLGADPKRNADLMGISFLAQNPGKRSVTLNLKSASGKRILKELVQNSDALVENFRPGVMARLGLDYDTLSHEILALSIVRSQALGRMDRWRNYPPMIRSSKG